MSPSGLQNPSVQRKGRAGGCQEYWALKAGAGSNLPLGLSVGCSQDERLLSGSRHYLPRRLPGASGLGVG